MSNLESRAGARDRHLHLSGEGLLHVPQLRQDLSPLHLLCIQPDDPLPVAGQTGEGNGPGDGRPAGAAGSALHNGDLGDAQLASLSDHGVLGLLALAQLLSRDAAVGGLLDIFSAGDLLALDGLLVGRQGGAGLLNSVAESSLLGRLGNTRLSSLHFIGLEAIIVSTQTTFIDNVSGVFKLNSLSVEGDSVEGSFQYNNIISRPVDSVRDLSISGGNFLLFISADWNKFTINKSLALLVGFRPGAGWLQDDLGALNKNFNFLLAINNLSKDSMSMGLAAVRAENVEAVIKLVSVGLVVKSLDNLISNNTFFPGTRSKESRNNLFLRSDSGSQGDYASQLFRQADVRVVNGFLFSSEHHIHGILLSVEHELNFNFILVVVTLADSRHEWHKTHLDSRVKDPGVSSDIRRHGRSFNSQLNLVQGGKFLNLSSAVFILLSAPP